MLIYITIENEKFGDAKEVVSSRKWTDNAMATQTSTIRQTMAEKALHSIRKIEQPEPY